MGCSLPVMDATKELLEIERAREARRRTRNKWLIALLVVAVLFGAFAIWGVTSKPIRISKLSPLVVAWARGITIVRSSTTEVRSEPSNWTGRSK